MSKLISKKLRGFRDILPTEAEKFQAIENIINSIIPLFNINQLRLPVLESSNLFKRSIGEQTDIVTKEMYTFDDNNGESICMVPEGTASCVRAVIENNLVYDRGIKKSRYYYYGPMFRHERPQKGRYRQFTQFGVEFFGESSFTEEIDLILLSKLIFDKLKIDDIQLNVNTIGSLESRKAYTVSLTNYLKQHTNKLSESQIQTLKSNPIRLLDSKDENIKNIINNAPLLTDEISSDSMNNYQNILQALDDLEVPYIENPRLVRGLDYYNDFVFEWTTTKLGTQDAICAGGRYDKLPSIIGNIDVPAVGFAIGIDRLVELYQHKGNNLLSLGLSLIMNQPEQHLNKILNNIRILDIPIKLIKMDLHKPLTKQIKQADKLNCDLLLIVGSEEISNNMYTLKYLTKNSEDIQVSSSELSEILKEIINE